MGGRWAEWDREYSLLLPKYSNPSDEGSRQRVSKKAIERYAHKMSENFKGVQISELVGCGTEDDGTLICEEMFKLASARDSMNHISSLSASVEEVEDEKFIEVLAANAAKEFGQWGIMTQKDKQDVAFVDGPSRETIYKRAVEKQSLSSLL